MLSPIAHAGRPSSRDSGSECDDAAPPGRRNPGGKDETLLAGDSRASVHLGLGVRG